MVSHCSHICTRSPTKLTGRANSLITRDNPNGVIDFALTNLDYAALATRLQQTSTNISYDPPKAGGRTKPDGTELKWEVTFPAGVERGNVPFWCEDVTPRERRVPITEASTTHPSGVLGMAGMELEVRGNAVARLEEAMGAIVDADGGGEGGFEVGAPRAVEGLKRPSIRLKEAARGAERELSLTLRLQTPDHRQQEAIRERIGDGVVSITFE